MPGTFRGPFFNALAQPTNEDRYDGWDLTTRPAMFPFLAEYTKQDTGEKAGGWAVPRAVTEPVRAWLNLGGNSLTEDGRLGMPNPLYPGNTQDMETLLWTGFGSNALKGAARAGKSAATEIASPHLAEAKTVPTDVLGINPESKGPWRVYHGTAANQQFDSFNRPPWMTDVPDIANAAAYPDIPASIEWTRNPGAPRVFPLDIEPKNPFVVDYDAPTGNIIKEAMNRYGYEYNPMADDHAVAAANGHDFIIYKNTPGDFGVEKKHMQIVPLQPNTVRSATTGETLFSDTGRPSLMGSAVSSAGHDVAGSGAVTQPDWLEQFLRNQY